LETVRTSPAVLVDAAHNPHGASALADALIEYYPGRLVGVVAMMADKDAEAFLGELEPVLEAVVVTGMSGERAMDAEELAGIARDVFGRDRVEVERDLLAAIDRAATLAEEDDDAPMTSPAVVVTGSIQLVGAARSLMGRPAPDGAGAAESATGQGARNRTVARLSGCAASEIDPRRAGGARAPRIPELSPAGLRSAYGLRAYLHPSQTRRRGTGSRR